jgi:hypothetical protein
VLQATNVNLANDNLLDDRNELLALRRFEGIAFAAWATRCDVLRCRSSEMLHMSALSAFPRERSIIHFRYRPKRLVSLITDGFEGARQLVQATVHANTLNGTSLFVEAANLTTR